MERLFAADNTPDAIGVVMRNAATFVKEQGASPRSMFITNLVLEEVLTNMVKYGFDDDAQHQIEVAAGVSEGKIILEFRDDGHPFDPLRAPPPVFGVPVKTQRLGGRGIFLVKMFVQQSNYRREDDRNILTLVFPAQAG